MNTAIEEAIKELERELTGLKETLAYIEPMSQGYIRATVAIASIEKDIQVIKKYLPKEREQIQMAYGAGEEAGEVRGRNHYEYHQKECMLSSTYYAKTYTTK